MQGGVGPLVEVELVVLVIEVLKMQPGHFLAVQFGEECFVALGIANRPALFE